MCFGRTRFIISLWSSFEAWPVTWMSSKKRTCLCLSLDCKSLLFAEIIGVGISLEEKITTSSSFS